MARKSWIPLLLIGVLATGAGVSQAAMVQMSLVVRNPMGTGTFGGVGVNSISVNAYNVSGTNLTPPITFRMTLPEGISFVDGSTNSGTFVCNATPTPRDVVCVRNTTWTTGLFAAALSFKVDIAANFSPVGPTEFTGTMENAQFPLPDPLDCVTTNGGTTQCAKDIVEIVQSQIHVDRITIDHDNILTAGDDEVARVRVRNSKRPATSPTAIPAAALSYPPLFGGVAGCRASVHGGRITWRRGDRAV